MKTIPYSHSGKSTHKESILSKFFKLRENNTTILNEIRAGFIGFLTVSYVIAVNPAILSKCDMEESHFIFSSSLAATTLTAALANAFAALITNTPLILVSGMGLNAYFTYSACRINPQSDPYITALFCSAMSGLFIILLTRMNVISYFTRKIPIYLCHAITCSIGLFQAFVGFQTVEWVVMEKDTIISLNSSGDIRTWFISISSLIIILSFLLRKWNGAIFIGMCFSYILSQFILNNVNHHGQSNDALNEFLTSIISKIPYLTESKYLLVIITFFLVSTLDIAGVITGLNVKRRQLSIHIERRISIEHSVENLYFISGSDDEPPKLGLPGPSALSDRLIFENQENYIEPRREDHNNSLFYIVGLFTFIGGLLGTSPLIVANETSVLLMEKGRTGLSTLTVSICFFLSYLIGSSNFFMNLPNSTVGVPMIVIGLFMFGNVGYVNWHEISVESISSFLTICVMVFTYSISNGVIVGIVSHFVFSIL